MQIERRDLEDRCKYVVWNEYGSHIIGSATLVDGDKPVLLKGINIQRNRRGRGIGSELLNRILSDFEDSEIIAEVFNARVRWYRRHGFELDEEFDQLVRVRRSPQ